MSIGILASAHVPFAAGGGYATEVLADSPIGYWKHDESSAATALVDSSGNGRDSGTSVVPCAFEATGLADGTAGYYDGINDTFNFSDAAWMDVASITVEAWINLPAIPSSSDEFVIGRWNATAGQRHFRITVDTSGRVRVLFRHNTNTNMELLSSAISTDTTYHVAATYNSSSGDYVLYLNGSSVASANKSGGGDLRTGTAVLSIGSVYDNTSNTQYIDAVIDEVALYDYALSSTRVAAHYAAA